MKNSLTLRKLVLCAMFIALSVIGAFFKPFGNSIAFDSMPAFVAASLMGPVFGAIVGALGHMISAMLSGFAPMGVVLHLIVAVEMIVVMFIYGMLARKVNIYVAAVAGILLNGVVATAVFIPILGMGFFLTMVGPLTLVTSINVVLAVMVHIALVNTKVMKANWS